MSPTVIWVFVALAAFVIVGYFVAMRWFVKEGQELDKKIDYTKIKKWQDED